MRMVGFAEYLEDLTKPLVRADAMPRDGDHIALLSGVNVHGRVSHVVPLSESVQLRACVSGCHQGKHGAGDDTDHTPEFELMRWFMRSSSYSGSKRAVKCLSVGGSNVILYPRSRGPRSATRAHTSIT